MRKSVTTIVIVVAVAFICFLAAGYAALRLARKPQATPLSLVTSTSRPVLPTKTQPKPAATSTQSPIEVPTQTTVAETQVPTQETQPESVCGQTGQMIILILGRSIHLPAYSHKADLVRLVKLDYDTQSAVVFAIPGELVVETPNLIQKYSTQTARLGDIYTIIINKEGLNSESEYRATQAVAQAILDNFGVAADHYITIEEDVVIQVVDTLNGVEVNLPQKFTMPSYSKYKGMVLQPGKYLFDGDMVHAYMTYRGNTSEEWQRFSHQNVILEALRTKLLDPSVFSKIPELFQLYKKNIVTDLSLEQIVASGCLSREVPAQSLTFNNIPSEKVVIGADGSMRLLDTPSVINQLQVQFGIP